MPVKKTLHKRSNKSVIHKIKNDLTNEEMYVCQIISEINKAYIDNKDLKDISQKVKEINLKE